MRRALPASLLLALALAALAAPATGAGTVVGRVAWIKPNVNGTPAGASPYPLKPPAPIEENMKVRTDANAQAGLTIGTREGAVIMGPDSDLVVRRGVVDVATGAAQELDFLTQLGQFRFVFVPPQKGPRHQVVIYPPHGAKVNLYGTDVYLSVTPVDLSVYVMEGVVVVTSGKGVSVRVGAGQWTRLAGDEPPTLPAGFRLTGLHPFIVGPVLPSDSPDFKVIPLPDLAK
jgi:hypothetical protein